MAMLSVIFVFLSPSKHMAGYVLGQMTTIFFHFLSNMSLNKYCTMEAVVVIKWSKGSIRNQREPMSVL